MAACKTAIKIAISHARREDNMGVAISFESSIQDQGKQAACKFI